MSMHLVGPYLTTTKYNSKNKKGSNTAAARQAKAAHEKWLRDRGLHPDQREQSRARHGQHTIVAPNLTVKENAPLSNKIDGNGLARGIMANLYKESPEVQRQIMEKASRTAPAFNKGAYQYITPGTDLSDVGRKK